MQCWHELQQRTTHSRECAHAHAPPPPHLADPEDVHPGAERAQPLARQGRGHVHLLGCLPCSHLRTAHGAGDHVQPGGGGTPATTRRKSRPHVPSLRRADGHGQVPSSRGVGACRQGGHNWKCTQARGGGGVLQRTVERARVRAPRTASAVAGSASSNASCDMSQRPRRCGPRPSVPNSTDPTARSVRASRVNLRAHPRAFGGSAGPGSRGVRAWREGVAAVPTGSGRGRGRAAAGRAGGRPRQGGAQPIALERGVGGARVAGAGCRTLAARLAPPSSRGKGGGERGRVALRDAAPGWPYAQHAAERGRDPDRAPRVGAQPYVHHAGRGRHLRGAWQAAGRAGAGTGQGRART